MRENRKDIKNQGNPENQEGSGSQGSSESQEVKEIQEKEKESAIEAEFSTEAGSCCTHKVKERDPGEYRDLIHRLNRIEGQVRGIKGMVEKDAYCADILVQVAAVNAALNSFNKVLLANHIKTCVTRDIREGKEETVDELVVLLQKLMK